MTDAVEIAWTESGRPYVLGPLGDEIEVSLAHDDETCLGSAAEFAHGCDIVAIEPRSEAEWVSLLGRAREPLLRELVELGDPPEVAGARLWAAAEATRKADGRKHVELSFVRRQDNAVLLKGNEHLVLTFPVMLTRNQDKMIALTVADDEATENGQQREHWVDDLPQVDEREHGYASPHLRTIVRATGPGGYPSTGARYHVSYREASSPSGSVYFPHYAFWLGKLRERGTAQPTNGRISKLMTSGKWGMVTNFSEIFVEGDLHADDIVEGNLWVSAIRGRFNSTNDIVAEWCKVADDGRLTRVAWGKMSTTWVEILGHGKVTPRPQPEYLDEFLRPMTVRSGEAVRPVPDEVVVDLGACLVEEVREPRRKTVISRRQFPTSSYEGNLVGNVYFANYYAWLGGVLDGYLHSVVPEQYRVGTNTGELRAVHTKVDHLREAMPFDTVETVMSLSAIHEYGLRLQFDYFNVRPDGGREKLAAAQHAAEWRTREGDRWQRKDKLPGRIVDAIRRDGTRETR
ncbi:hypothetical protein ACWEV3_12435 [Saccharopolyspora sp. NPDC003752]